MEHAQPTSQATGLSRSWISPPGASRLRVVPWQGDRYTALVGPSRTGRVPRTPDVAQCLQQLEERGVRQAVTPAMSPLDSQPFLDAGFGLHERLHLLARQVSTSPPTSEHPLRIGRPWHRKAVLDIDHRAFEPFWRFDHASLKEARRATPTSRFRVARLGDGVAGYAVTGRAGERGYLQRLAVDPGHAGQGLGSALVNDAVGWLHRRGSSTILVNTQERNVRALALYEHLGFVRQPAGLLVLRWDNPT